MATKKKADIEIASLQDEEPGASRPRLQKLIIKNFRGIGQHAVEIELDDVVVLVGPNNAGKSSILRAYQLVMMQGSKEGKLTIDDFYNRVVDSQALPEVELHTIIFSNSPGERWIKKTADGENLIREKWIWESPCRASRQAGQNA